MNPTIKNALNQTVAFLTNTVVGIQISRVITFTASSFAFITLVYAGLVLGMDIPEWRMSGNTARIYSQVALCVALFIIAMGSYILCQLASEKLVALKGNDEIDEEDEI